MKKVVVAVFIGAVCFVSSFIAGQIIIVGEYTDIVNLTPFVVLTLPFSLEISLLGLGLYSLVGLFKPNSRLANVIFIAFRVLIGIIAGSLAAFAWTVIVELIGKRSVFVFPLLLSWIIGGGVGVIFATALPATKSIARIAQQGISVTLGLGLLLATWETRLTLLDISRQGTDIETYRMEWSYNDCCGCKYHVELEFESAPGYIIYTCSIDLLDSLKQTNVNPVEVKIERTYEPRVWHYTIKQVGQWGGTAEFQGPQWSCRVPVGMSSTDTNCGKVRPPIQEPYTLK